MLVGDTPASHQDAPEAKADADRASSVAADPPVLSHRGGVVGRQSRLRVVWPALPWSMPYIAYGYGYGGCGWLYRNAVATGDAYWWNRYYNCTGYY
jgi:hypothetical protein